MISSVRNLRSGKSALKWLILIGLLWAQFAYSSHQLMHGTDELGEACQVCTGYEHFDNALNPAACEATIPAAASALPTSFEILEATDRLTFYSARASPQTPYSSF